jgi:outer membrane protein assembly factor BamB
VHLPNITKGHHRAVATNRIDTGRSGTLGANSQADYGRRMAQGRLVGRIEAFLGLIGIIALVVTYSIVTGWNPLPKVQSWLAGVTATTLSKPAPLWIVRSGDQPDTATVLPNAIVVTAEGSVEARNPGDGKLLWTYTDSWAAVGGGARPVVLVGRPVGGGFDVYDATSGVRLWSDGNRDAVWPFQDMILVLHCAHDFDCALYADEPTTGSHMWSVPISAAGSSTHGLGRPLATLQPITGDYTKSLGAVPVDVPSLIGLNLDGDIHVVSTAHGHELRVYPAKPTQRVVVAGHDVLVATSIIHGDGCTYTLSARDPATNNTLWIRSGYNAHTSTALGCDQRNDPKGAGGVFLATDMNGRDVLLSVGTGQVVYRAPPDAHFVATDGNVAVVRSADGKTLTTVSASSGAPLWSRAAAAAALVGIGPDGVMIVDPGNSRLVVTAPRTGAVLVNVESGATILGVGQRALIVNIGRSFGPILVRTSAAVHP